MNKMYTVYLHRNQINGKVYIGQTCQVLSQRFGSDGNGYKKSPYFWSAIQKYGWDNFEHIVLKENLLQEEANYYEKKYIQEYHSNDKDYGYNLLAGGYHWRTVEG